MSPLATLEEIVSNSPAVEPRDGPTVGFQRPADPEYDDHANEVVEEAFREGVSRGWWEAAQLAIPAIDAPAGPTLEQQIAALVRQHGLSALTITAYAGWDGEVYFGSSAHGDGKCAQSDFGMPHDTPIAAVTASAIDALNAKRTVKADVPALAPMGVAA